MIIDKIYSDRLRYDGESIIPFNDLQKQEIIKFRKFLDMGYYREEQIVNCPLCGSVEGFLIAEKDRYGLPVKTVICQQCGLIRSYNRLDNHSTNLFYKEQYRILYEGVEATDQKNQRYFQNAYRRVKSVVRFVNLWSLKPEKHLVVDIGSGGGWNLIPYKELGFRCVGSDYDDNYLNLGRERGLEMIQGGPEEVQSVIGTSADLVLLNHVLEHVADPVKFLLQVVKVMKSNALLFISAPGLRGIRYGYSRGDLLGTLQNAHNYLYDLKTLTWIANKSNLKLLLGNEGIAAVFEKNGEVQDVSFPSARGEKTLSYLRSLEITRPYWMLWDKLTQFVPDPYRVRNMIRRVHFCLGFPRNFFLRHVADWWLTTLGKSRR